MKGRIRAAVMTLLLAAGLIIITATPASATVYHGCPSGVGCMWHDINGGGPRVTIAVGQYGYNTCWNVAAADNDLTSSASADYGGGWDLKMFYNANCSYSGYNDVGIKTSHFANFTGLYAYFNDKASSFMIVQL